MPELKMGSDEQVHQTPEQEGLALGLNMGSDERVHQTPEQEDLVLGLNMGSDELVHQTPEFGETMGLLRGLKKAFF
ncbi:hypothetical protein GCM10009113_15190 [Marinobacter szutsaonensis]